MATTSLPSDGSRGSAAALARARAWSPGAVLVALALPVLFLHVRYQPGFDVAVGSTSATAYLSDVAIWAVLVAALASGVRSGFAPLAAGRWLWLAAALLFVWIFAGLALGAARTPGYSWHVHGVTAAKLLEYALLAPALPLLLRRRDDTTPLYGMLTLWSVVATVVGIAQFFGAQIFLSGTVGRRQASFLSSLDFASLSSAALLTGVVGLALPELRLDRRLAAVALASGVLGTIVGGSLSAVLGDLTAVAVVGALLVVRRRLDVRRLLPVAAAAVVLVLGAVAIRGSDLDAFARFLGATPGKQAQQTKVQTYAHRTLLIWLGYRIWLDHPLAGSGFEASAEPGAFEPHLPAAHRRFPDEAPLAFPSRAPDRRYGVQDLYVQTLADLGAIGAALLAAVFAAALALAVRARGALGVLGAGLVALLLWLWTAQGWVAGIPLDALTWLSFGLVATAAHRHRADG